MVKQGRRVSIMFLPNIVSFAERTRHHYHSTPVRPQPIHPHIRHPSTSSSTCSSPTNQEQLHSPVDEKECRNTR